jgi:hypothetical protein
MTLPSITSFLAFFNGDRVPHVSTGSFIAMRHALILRCLSGNENTFFAHQVLYKAWLLFKEKQLEGG